MGEPQEATGAARWRARLGRGVHEQPWLALGAALAVGGVLGGVAFTRLGRLAFAVAAGFVAHGLRDRRDRGAT